MSLAFLAYLVFHVPVVMSSVSNLVFLVTFLWYLATSLFMLLVADGNPESEEGVKITKLMRVYPYKSACAILTLSLFIPNQDNMKIIVGAHMTQVVAEKIVEIEGVRQVPENLVRFINEKLILQEEPVETLEE